MILPLYIQKRDHKGIRTGATDYKDVLSLSYKETDNIFYQEDKIICINKFAEQRIIASRLDVHEHNILILGKYIYDEANLFKPYTILDRVIFLYNDDINLKSFKHKNKGLFRQVKIKKILKGL